MAGLSWYDTLVVCPGCGSLPETWGIIRISYICKVQGESLETRAIHDSLYAKRSRASRRSHPMPSLSLSLDQELES